MKNVKSIKNELKKLQDCSSTQVKRTSKWCFFVPLAFSLMLSSCATFKSKKVEHINVVAELNKLNKEDLNSSSRTESIYVGSGLTVQGYTAKLECVSIPYANTPAKATIRLFDANGKDTGKAITLSSKEPKWISAGSDDICICLYEINSGLTPLDSWAVIGMDVVR